jgi:hypothetical protein
MSDSNQRPWWSHSAQEHKKQIEDAIESHLLQADDLTDRQKFLLREAIGDAYRGLYGLAIQGIYELGLDESAWSKPVEPIMVEGVSREGLRAALEVIRSAPPQAPPVFGKV